MAGLVPPVVTREALEAAITFAVAQPNGASFTKPQLDAFAREMRLARTLECELQEAREALQALRDKLTKARRPTVRAFLRSLGTDHPERTITIALGRKS